MSSFLTSDQVKEYKRIHKSASAEKRDRIKALLMLDSGYSHQEIARVLLIDESTVWRWLQVYKNQGLHALLKDKYKGGTTKLTEDQITELDAQLSDKIYLDAKEICAYVLAQYGIEYTSKGMTNLLHRMGYSYKKPKHIPGKANLAAQVDFMEKYKQLKQEKSPEDQIYFMDGVHPLHNSQPAYGWMKKDCDYTIQSNTGRERININGAVNIETLQVHYREDETIDSESAINLFHQILNAQNSGKAYVFADNARYYKSQLIRDFLDLNPRLILMYFPPYSPNLNLIERLWRFLRKNVTYNKYYEKFAVFRFAITHFLDSIDTHKAQLRTLLTENFQIIDPL